MMPLEQLTVVPEQVLPDPTPTTVTALQVRPSKTSRSDRSTPMLFRRAVPAAELACTWTGQRTTFDLTRTLRPTGMVLVQHAVVGVSVRASSGAGVATARRGKTRGVKARMRENIVP